MRTSPSMPQRIYLDANAGAPLLPEAREAAAAALGVGNPSSVHSEGRKAREIVDAARIAVAAAVGADADNVVFTSGATEAAAMALAPVLMSGAQSIRVNRLYVGATEHSAVLGGGRFPAAAVRRLSVERSGVFDMAALARALDEHDPADGPPCIAIMLANNETGVIHPVAEATSLIKAHGGIVICDAVQALGRIRVDIAELGVDFLALSSHKIGGPQGAGALVLRDSTLRPAPLLTGGGQERRLRSGTENVAAIAGFGVAATRADHHLTQAGRIASLRAELERGLVEVSPEVRIIGVEAARLPNTTLFATPGIAAETAVIAFDLHGVAVSAGSACSSGKTAASHVLQAMGEPADIVRGGIRVSLAPSADEVDVAGFIAAWRTIHSRMGRRRAA